MLRLTESEEEDYWQKLEIGKNFNAAAADKLMKLENRENGVLHSTPDENNNNVNNYHNHHHRSSSPSNSSLVLEDDDVILENSNNSLLIVSEIPSTVFNYPRRIILGLCLKLRRKQIFQFQFMESNMISFSSSSSSSGSKSSPSKSNNNSSSCNCNCNCRGDLPGINNHSTSRLEGETSNLKFRRRKTPTTTENMTPTSLKLEKNTNNGRLKLENFECLVENPCCKNSEKTRNSNHVPNPLLSSENSSSNSKALSHSHRMSSPSSPSLWFTSKSNNETGFGSGSGPGTGAATGGLRTMRRVGLGFRHGGTGLWRTLFLVLFYLLILLDSSVGCGPGRGAGRRRAPRKLTPLVYKQHVPNVPENTLSASGLNEGKINRDHPRFKALVPNYNTDIIFRDDEGTGADRLMSQRCKEKLNTLAISVMNQWPGVRLRVIEGWDEGNHHSTSSLHYEGRAVDITTSDKDRSKYGMLARLAVEAGFDWVYYESRAHIHCSVKSDSSQAARSGGCFSENATVVTTEGRRKITEVRPGDSVLSVNDKGETVFSEVVMFLDRNSTETREFYHVTTSSGASLALTPSHLIFKVDRVIGDNLLKTNSDSNSISNYIDSNFEILASEQLLASAQVTFAKNIEAGDWLLVVSPSSSEFLKSSSADGEKREVQLEKVVHMEARLSTGVYAPLTKQGNVIVDNVLASCYAVVNDQSLAHWAFSPVRFVVNVYEAIGHAWRQFSRLVTFRPVHLHSHSQPSPQLDDFHQNPFTAAFTKVISHKELPAIVSRADESNNLPSARKISEQGVHWYASFLYSTSYYLIPSHLLYESS